MLKKFNKTNFIKTGIGIVSIVALVMSFFAGAFMLISAQKKTEGNYLLIAGEPTNTSTEITWISDGNYASEFAGGTGDVTDPYLIETPKQLARLSYLSYSGSLGSAQNVYFKQMADLDMSEFYWQPIGSNWSFSGNYDGNNYKISGLYTIYDPINNGDIDNKGLFACIETAYGTGVKNVTIENSEIRGANYVGSIAGKIIDSSSSSEAQLMSYLSNCKSSATVIGANTVGGIVGDGFAVNCSFSGEVKTDESLFEHYDRSYFGGIVGNATKQIINCSNTGLISGGSYVGGIAGRMPHGYEIKNCVNSGRVSGNMYIGGIVGQAQNYVSNCQNFAIINGTGDYVGGIVGGLGYYSTVSNCFNDGSVNSTANQVGGIVGYGEGDIYNSYNAGAISGAVAVGGIRGGGNYNNIQSVFNLGAVSSTQGELMGNISGDGSGSIKYSYYGGNALEEIGAVSNEDFYSLTEVKFLPEINTLAKDESWYSNSEVWGNKTWDLSYWIFDPLENDGFPTVNDINEWLYAIDVDFEGEGTPLSPYLISSPGELAGLSYLVSSQNLEYGTKFYKQTADLDMSGKIWSRIGNYSNRFNGIYDGEGFTISGLNTGNNQDYYNGLFGYINTKAIIYNVNIKDSVISGANYIGSIAGHTYGGQIINCSSSATVSGESWVGGIVGYSDSTIRNCSFTGNVSGTGMYAGGICGLSEGLIRNAYNVNSVSGSDYVGGISGGAYEDLNNVYNLGEVSGSNNVGGIVGNCPAQRMRLQNIFNTGYVNSNGTKGNLVGSSEFSEISYAYYGGAALAEVGATPDDQTLADKLTKVEYLEGLESLTKESTWYANELLWSDGAWDFEFIWTLDPSENSGYPIINSNSMDMDFNFVGSGEENDPYIIDSPEKLMAVSVLVNNFNDVYANKAYKQTADLDMSGKIWTPIGTEDNPFAGSYDGGNFTISGLKTEETIQNAGLFGYAMGGSSQKVSVKNLTIDNSVIMGATIGGIIATGNNLDIFNCHTSETVQISSRNADAGGIFGGMSELSGSSVYITISSCSNSASISVGNYSGGIAGVLAIGKGTSKFTIVDCYNTADNLSGGIIGWLSEAKAGQSVIESCYNTGDNVNAGIAFISSASIINCYNTGTALMAGIVGAEYGTNLKIENCYNTGNITNNDPDELGGDPIGVSGWVAGIAYATMGYVEIKNCYNEGTLTGHSVAGIVGGHGGQGDCSISNCYNFGDLVVNKTVSEKGYKSIAGGIICQGDTVNSNLSSAVYEITNCYNAGEITGGTADYVGGIVGANVAGGRVENSFNTGTISVNSATNMGGISGTNVGSIKNSYYAGKEITGAVGTFEENLVYNAKNLAWYTTANMGWDFDKVWNFKTGMNDGYPYLRSSEKITVTVNIGDGNLLSANGWTFVDGSSTALTKQIGWGTRISIFPTVEKEGYICVGWYTNDGENISSSSAITSEIELYAKYLDSWQNYKSESLQNVDGRYLITSGADLAFMAYQVNQGNPEYVQASYLQTADIDLSAHYWVSIGNSDAPFMGKYDGNNFKISNIVIGELPPDTRNGGFFGLFGMVMSQGANTAELKNIIIENFVVGDYLQMNADGAGFGALVGAGMGVSIDNCHVMGQISIADLGADMAYVGGLAGAVMGSVSNCSVRGGKLSGDMVGGIAGMGSNIKFTNCVNYCDVSAPMNDDQYMAGGIAGAAIEGYASFERCYNYGDVSGGLAGGIFGNAGYVSMTEAYNFGNVEGYAVAGGLIAGSYLADLNYVYNMGNVSAMGQAGGIIGALQGRSYSNYSGISIKNAFNSGNVSSAMACGGLAGGMSTSEGDNIIDGFLNTGHLSIDYVGNMSGGGVIGGLFGGLSIRSHTEDQYDENGSWVSSVTTYDKMTIQDVLILGEINLNLTNDSSMMISDFIGFPEFNSESEFIVKNCGTNILIASSNEISVSDVSNTQNEIILHLLAQWDAMGMKVASNSYSFAQFENILKIGTEVPTKLESAKYITTDHGNMDNNFAYNVNFMGGLPIPNGLYWIVGQFDTTTGIYNQLESLGGVVFAESSAVSNAA